MKRRDFIALNFAALGGVVLGTDISYANVLKEIDNTFTGIDPREGYDIIINGAGVVGCLAALEASRKGLKVLVVDKRTSPGFEITAKRKLWLKTTGQEKWPVELNELLCPEAEKNEIFNRQLNGLNKSCIDNEMLLFAGSIKKGLLRSLLVAKVDVLLMTDIWGILTGEKNDVSGITLACKHGVFSVPCKHFIDSTDNLFFTRDLTGEKYTIDSAGFVIELDKANLNVSKLHVHGSLGIINDTLHVHKGKKSSEQCFLSFRFSTKTKDLSVIEQRAREITGKIGENLTLIHSGLSDAKIRYYAQECTYFLNKKKKPAVALKGYTCLESLSEDEYSLESILSKKGYIDQTITNLRLSPQRAEHRFINYSGQKEVLNFSLENKGLNENGIILPLTPFPVESLKIETQQHSLVIAGGGTAGVITALSAAEKGVKPTVIEYFNDLGGTKTMGGVVGYYLGLNKHPYISSLEKNIKDTAAKHNITGAVSRSYYHYKSLKDYSHTIINGALICGAKTTNNKLEQILICVNGKLQYIKPDLSIDSTGDGDVAFFAGENFTLGNSRMGLTQNYSQWDLPYNNPKFPSQSINKDYDILDNTQIRELQRGFYLSHYESLYYDFYPMLTVRESRRPEGIYCLDLIDVLEERFFDDTIANAYSDFDPHYFGGSEYTRCTFLLPHSNKLTVNIPYRAIVPKRIDGLLLSGRGISQTHNALQFTRMSADVALLGYATGQIAAEIINRKQTPRSFSVTTLHQEWLKEGFIVTNNQQSKKETTDEIVKKLIEGKSEYLPVCCRQEKSKILPVLQNQYSSNPTVLLAKALAWFGDSRGNNLIREELQEWFMQEQQVGHPDWYYEEYKPNLYWKINQNIALLGMTRDNENNNLIRNIVSKTHAGGEKVKAGDRYNQNRIDLYLIPFYNRILNLCFYIERNPDVSFIEELDRLSNDKEIKYHLSSEYETTRWRVYGALLELTIAAASARCGSKNGLLLLADYLSDIHSDFRKFAYKELKDILGMDFSYETRAWRSFIQQNYQSKGKTTPLLKDIEL